jgi:hypothetical protein
LEEIKDEYIILTGNLKEKGHVVDYVVGGG